MATDWTAKQSLAEVFGIMAACHGCSDGEDYPCPACKRHIAALAAEAFAAGQASTNAYQAGEHDGEARGHAAGVAEERERCAAWLEDLDAYELQRSWLGFYEYEWPQKIAAALRAREG